MWARAGSLLLGLWLVVSPIAVGRTATQPQLEVWLGLLVIVVAAGAMLVSRVRLALTGLAIALLAAPVIAPFGLARGANLILVGVALLATSFVPTVRPETPVTPFLPHAHRE
jgi:hypothetical protein